MSQEVLLEVDYFDSCERLRTKRIPKMEERLIPFILKKQDRKFNKIWRIREVPPGSNTTGRA
jgi:hypothetical protein